MAKHNWIAITAIGIAAAALLIALAFGMSGMALAGGATGEVDAKGGSKLPPEAQPPPSSTSGCSFAGVPSPNTGPPNQLRGVVALTANDTWAVGVFFNVDAGDVAQTLAEHWDGTAWSVVTSPNGGIQESELNDVAATSASDVWAVGDYRPDGSTSNQALIEHWNGTRWSVVPSPNLGPFSNFLYGVTATAANDAWAVGYYPHGSIDVPLFEHWDGTIWNAVAGPTPALGGQLKGVSGLAPNDVWAVGFYIDTGSVSKTLVDHWDGANWTVVSSPNPGATSNELSSVSEQSGSDVWAVGSYVDQNSAGRTLIEHWNGILDGWSMVPSPNQGPYENELHGVAAISANDVWTTGDYSRDTGGHQNTLAEHWDGTQWSIVPSADPGTQNNFFQGVSGLGTGDVWVVGNFDQFHAGLLTLVEHWNGSAWSVVSSQNPGVAENGLNSVAAVSANDVWAVGGGTNPSTNTFITLAEHWDGTRWNIVPDPGQDLPRGTLYGVDALAANDVWAVGGYISQTAGRYQTLTEHWDGAQWSVVPSPNVASSDNGLNGVFALTSNDVWAVGQYSVTGSSRTLVEHWDGTQWSIISSADAGDFDSLHAVAALAANDAWAVGSFSTGQTDHVLIEHWNGAAWTQASGPDPSGGFLYGVAASAVVRGPKGPTPAQAADRPRTPLIDVWAVGNYFAGVEKTLVEHWDGTQWSIVPSPSPGTGANYLNAVAAISTNDVWTVGMYSDGMNPPQPLAEHWNGSAWSIVPAENSYSRGTILYGVSPVGANDIWAVGGGNDGASASTLAEHYTCAPCTLQFEDVPHGSTFYPFVRCMACQGIINGYACGGPGEPCNGNHDPYFRPNANVTRGQIAKIVALSSANHSPVSGQHFHDVPPGSTFYTYTEQLAALGVMSGYPCGGVGEPCGPGNLPYFRPNSSATRGQLSKIDANAAGYHDTPNGRQFQDVAPASTYYTYTYRLVSRTIMGGYACGGVGEPCGPGNLPYFRPNANVTRGQTSKIVGNTFFPDCRTP